MRRLALALFAFSLGAVPAEGQAQPAAAIVGVRLIDGTGGPAVDDATILISGGKIAAVGPRAAVQVPPDAVRLDGAGKTAIPGLIDAHCHLNQPADVMRRLLPVALNWGVTTMRMAGNDKPEIMHIYAEARRGDFASPRIFSAGQGFNATGGPYPGAPTLRPATPEEARAGVRSHKALGAQVIKIWMTEPGFGAPVLEALVDEARLQGLPVTAHIGNAAQVRQLAELGVTDFMHQARDGMNPEFIAYALARGLSFAPTLGQGQSRWFYYEHPEILAMDERFDGFYARGRAMLNDPARRQEIIGAPDFAAVKQRFRDNNYPFIKMMSDAGVRIIAGTDCGAEASQTTPVGHTTHREIAMFVEAGMSPPVAIRAATLDAARVLEQTEDPPYGVIAPGKIADLVLVNGDPSVDIADTTRIERVMQAGRWVLEP